MAVYEFVVLSPDQTVLARNVVELDNGKAAWAQVAALAWKLGEISGLIKVTDAEGALVILTGVSSARRATSRPPPAPREI